METVDPTLPYTELTLSGTTFKLCMKFSAIAKAERHLKKLGVIEPGATLLFANYFRDMTTVPALFAASLLTYQPETDLTAAMEMVDWSNNGSVSLAVDAAFELYMPKPTPEQEAAADEQPDPPTPDQ